MSRPYLFVHPEFFRPPYMGLGIGMDSVSSASRTGTCLAVQIFALRLTGDRPRDSFKKEAIRVTIQCAYFHNELNDLLGKLMNWNIPLSAGNHPDNLSGSSRGKSIRVTPTNVDSNVKPRIRVPLPTGMLTDMEHRQIGWGEGCERVTAYIRLGRGGEGGSGGGGVVDGLDKVAHVEPLWAPVNHGRCRRHLWTVSARGRAKEAPKVLPPPRLPFRTRRQPDRSRPIRPSASVRPTIPPFYCVACQLSVRPSPRCPRR